MSGICGIFALDGSVPSPAQIAAMTAPLERRGPDGTHYVLRGSVALGHTLLATTPEALIEILPLTDSATGCVITGDIRLDNRDELFPSLGQETDLSPVGDGALVLRAYLNWGEACVDHLLGDFAFAVWDPRSSRLFCARDHTGMRQLLYHHQPGRLFVFATEARAVLAHPDVHRNINETRIADYLLGFEGADFESTFFSGVLRLPPAHCLTVDSHGSVIRRYWTLKMGPLLRLGSDEEYAEAFLEVFTEAVRCRMRSAGQLGSMLSGGIDSGSVVAVAARLLAAAKAPALRTFSAIASEPDACRESRTIFEAVKIPHLDPVMFDPDVLDRAGAEVLKLTQDVEEPFDAHMVMVRTLYHQAREAGISVMLEGVNGDVALTTETLLPRLIRGGSWGRAWREAKGDEAFYEGGWTRWHALKAGILRATVPDWIRWVRRRLPQNRVVSGIHPTFARRINATGRFDHYWRLNGALGRTFREDRERAMMAANPVVGRERYDRVAASCAIECRDPFMDIRVLEFSMRLPARLLHRDGWRKLILRNAMRGFLPCEIVWRRGKEHVGWLFTKKLLEMFPLYRQLDASEVAATDSYVADIGTYIAGQPSAGTDMGWFGFQVVSLAHWLRTQFTSGNCPHGGDRRKNG